MKRARSLLGLERSASVGVERGSWWSATRAIALEGRSVASSCATRTVTPKIWKSRYRMGLPIED